MNKPKLQTICVSRTHCVQCRASEKFRGEIAEHFEVPDNWPACPYGKTLVQVSTASRTVGKIASNPKIAERIARKRLPGEKGVGDTLERLLSKAGGNVFKAAYQRITGRSCGCGDIKARLNADFPYPVE